MVFMNRLDLILKINQLNKELKNKFIEKYKENPCKYAYLYEKWEPIKIKNENWYQFAKLAIKFDQAELMINRIRSVFHDKEYLIDGDCSKISFNSNINTKSNIFIKFEELQSLFIEFTEILSMIKKQIYFEHHISIKFDSMYHNKINWDMTIQKNKTKFPLKFYIKKNHKKFNIPENNLLAISNIWLKVESEKLLKFYNKFNTMEISILLNIIETSTKNEFLFKTLFNINIIDDVKYTNLEASDLLKNVHNRLRICRTLDNSYNELFLWVKKFQQYSIMELSNNNVSYITIETIKNIDIVYEVWIFAEIVDYIIKKYNTKINFNFDQYVEFQFDGKTFKIYYQRNFIDNEIWVENAKPDFSIYCDEKLIAIIDAKNYLLESKETGRSKILAYMMNLKCNFGVGIFPKIESKPYEKDIDTFSNIKLTLHTLSMIPYTKNYDTDVTKSLKTLFDGVVKNAQMLSY